MTRAGGEEARARRSNSASRRVFPTPDSPATKTMDGLPAAESAKAASNSASSLPLPTTRALVIRVATAPVLRRDPMSGTCVAEVGKVRLHQMTIDVAEHAPDPELRQRL